MMLTQSCRPQWRSERVFLVFWKTPLKMSLKNLLENATALGSRIPPHAVLLHVNNTPVKLKIIFAI